MVENETPIAFRYRKRVEFAETDAAGILHFSNYYRFMEIAEHAFLRSLFGRSHEPRLGWPRVSVSCDYFKPLRFEQEVDILVTVRELRRKSVTYDFFFQPPDKENPELLARGSMTVVCVGFDDNGEISGAITIPAAIAKAITAASAAVNDNKED